MTRWTNTANTSRHLTVSSWKETGVIHNIMCQHWQYYWSLLTHPLDKAGTLTDLHSYKIQDCKPLAPVPPFHCNSYNLEDILCKIRHHHHWMYHLDTAAKWSVTIISMNHDIIQFGLTMQWVDPAGLKVPGVHSTGVWVGSTHWWPTGQTWQDVNPWSSANWPRGHGTGGREGMGQWNPGRQGTQLVRFENSPSWQELGDWPGDEQEWPLGQGLQMTDPRNENSPGLQMTGSWSGRGHM